jgi:hypothetical protein
MKWKWKKRKKGKGLDRKDKNEQVKRITLDSTYMNEQENEGNNKENWNRIDRDEREKEK